MSREQAQTCPPRWALRSAVTGAHVFFAAWGKFEPYSASDAQAAIHVRLTVTGEAGAERRDRLGLAPERHDLLAPLQMQQRQPRLCSQCPFGQVELHLGRHRPVLQRMCDEEDLVGNGPGRELTREPAIGAAVEPSGRQTLDFRVGGFRFGIAPQVEQGEGGLVTTVRIVAIGGRSPLEVSEGLGVFALAAAGLSRPGGLGLEARDQHPRRRHRRAAGEPNITATRVTVSMPER
ncbi:hypothetical protein POL25_05030 [Nannocystis sp. bb15-2]|uniref:Uncharacterized protein n=1 Tax=Nannocystis bainbridge TaxID=2995303 RepID=A0ABT5DRK4_9BACT|nr:hypothetical protein [Nannocystis bainbridge]MDC0716243.1 hypothetical protein [Nannocystis bainbridge]